jgi:trehalose 6-phosphate phosphatase
MPLPRAQATFGSILSRFATARERVLLLDFDGTLAPFTKNPLGASPYAGITPVLDDIMAQPRSRVVIVTGRDLLEQPPALPLRRAPEMWGAHGWQWCSPGGAPVALKPPPAIRDQLAAAADCAQAVERWDARLERKPASVAVHWRGLEPAAREAVREYMVRAWRGVTRSRDLELIDVAEGLELRARGRNKGTVVRQVLAATPGAAAAYLGDDRADEDAFAAIRGRGCGVLVRPSWRRTHATRWLRPPSGVIAFLERWREFAPCDS